MSNMLGTLLRVAFVPYVLISSAAAFYIGFRVHNATCEAVNGIYICSSDARCTLLPRAEVERSGSRADVHSTYTLSSTNAFVNGIVQNRWFISKTSPVADGGKMSNVKVYGAIELAAEPTLQLKAWKRLGTDWAFEPNILMVPVGTMLQNTDAVDERSVVSLLESANILLAAYQHTDLDRRSDRGRFILTALQEHQHMLSDSFTTDDTLLEEEVALFEVFQCDYQAVLGGGSTVDNCYVSAIQRLKVLYLERQGSTVTPITLHSTHHYSALHCADAVDAINCHIQYATVRHARHLLFHSVDPVQALAVLQSSNMVLHSEQAEVWQILSYCLLGLCNNNHITVDKTESTVVFSTASLTNNISVGLDTAMGECDAILAVLHAHGGNEVIHTLFTKVCFPFQQLQHHLATISGAGAMPSLFSADKRTIIDQSRTIIASLLSVGAVELAAQYTSNVLQYALGITSYSKEGANINDPANIDASLLNPELLTLAQTYPSLQLVVAPSADSTVADALMLHSPNVRAALLLSHLLHRIRADDAHWRAFLGSSDLLSNFLNTMFHATSPVILSSTALSVSQDTTATADGTAEQPAASPVSWLQEAVVLRYVMVHTLRTVVDACTTKDSIVCEIIDPASSVGARGLFLLAYQGLGLLTETLEATAHLMGSLSSSGTPNLGFEETMRELSWFLRDSTVPSLYQDLLRRASSELINISPFQHTSSAVEASAPGSCESGTCDQSCSATTVTTMTAATPKSERIKVAFLSYFFRRHPVGRLLAKIIVNLNHTVFDVHIITVNDNKLDDVTAYLRQHIAPEQWMYITHNMAAATDIIRQQQFDVVVYGDVFMDANMAHFATVKLAPVQVCFWGHPFTTGYGSMDYFITSDAFEQKEAKFRHTQYAEQLVRFDSLSYQLLEPESEPAVSSAERAVDANTEAPRWPAIPAYSLRGLRSAWDDEVTPLASTGSLLHQASTPATTTVTAIETSAAEPFGLEHTNNDIDQDFFQRRLQVLRWVTSVGFDIHDMPIDEASLIDTLRAADTTTTSHSAEAHAIEFVSSVRLYGALQSLFKMHPLFDLALAEILTRDAHAVVLLSRNGRQRHWEQAFRDRLASTLRSYAEKRNKSLSNLSDSALKDEENKLLSRVLFVNQMQHAQYQLLLCSLDVTLDTFPFGGGVTLSDALGGCGLNAPQAVFHNYKRDIYHSVVPFVTSGQLQSVHQIGAGMAEKLGPNMTDFARSTSALGTAQQTSELNAKVQRCLNQGSPTTCVGSAMSAQLNQVHMQYIQEYAGEAVALATKSQTRKMHQAPVEGRSTADDTAARTRTSDVLYDSLDAAKEWSLFLQNIVRMHL